MSEQELKVQEKHSAQTQGESTKDEPCYAPQVDIFETEHEMVVVADMPGVRPEGVDISLEDNVMPAAAGRFWKNMCRATISGALPWRKALTRSISPPPWPTACSRCDCPRQRRPSQGRLWSAPDEPGRH